MRCSDAHEWISAALDHETPPEIHRPLDDHLAGCPDCRRFRTEIGDQHRSFRVHAAPSEPDRTAEILAALGRPPALGPASAHDPERTLRWIIAALAIFQFAAAVPLLFVVDHSGAGHGTVHLERHIGTSAIALAIGLLIVAWRPARAATMLPVLAVLVIGLAWSCLADIVAGRPVPGSAFAHGLDVAGLVAVAMLYRVQRTRQGVGRGVLAR